MFAVISPAKTLDFDSQLPTLPVESLPRFLDDSAHLIGLLRDKSPADIAGLMKVSDKIAHLNVDRYALWRKDMSDDKHCRAAAFAFRGDTYTGLNIDTFSREQLLAAQQKVRILSGLYGLLRTLDRIRPYRLEMGTRLAGEHGATLYQYWGDRLTQQLAADMQEAGSELLVNLASQEYFKAISAAKLGFPVITPVFEDEKNGQFKVISFYAKKARGMMAGWIATEGITTAADLANFNLHGYCYDAAASSPSAPLFKRSEAARSA